jgi:methionyl aminopeptidase
MDNKKSSSSSKNKRTAPSGFAGKLRDVRTIKFPYAGDVRPGQQSPQHQVLDATITKPDYADTGIPSRASKPLLPWIVEVKTAEQVLKMRASGKLGREILDLAGRQVKVGVTTDQIDKVVHDAILAVRRLWRRADMIWLL